MEHILQRLGGLFIGMTIGAPIGIAICIFIVDPIQSWMWHRESLLYIFWDNHFGKGAHGL